MLCEVCGTKFMTKQPRRAKYCSRQCGGRARRIRIRYQEWLEARKARNALVEKAIKEEAATYVASNA
jgi:hypothetical protein